MAQQNEEEAAELICRFIFFACSSADDFFAQKATPPRINTDQVIARSAKIAKERRKFGTHDEFGGLSFSIWIFWQYSAILAILIHVHPW